MYRKTARYTGFFERRRARQARRAESRSYTFELAALHLELLVAMAAVDDQVHTIEVDEVLSFIDRAALPRDEIERLELLATGIVRHPPVLEPLLASLERFAGRTSLATMLVNDLAKVAAADARADPREITLLNTICDSLHVERVSIHVPDAGGPGGAGSTAGTRSHAGRGPRLVAHHRVRAQVRRALDDSYASRDDVA